MAVACWMVKCCLEGALVVRERLGGGAEGEAGTEVVARAGRFGSVCSVDDRSVAEFWGRVRWITIFAIFLTAWNAYFKRHGVSDAEGSMRDGRPDTYNGSGGFVP